MAKHTQKTAERRPNETRKNANAGSNWVKTEEKDRCVVGKFQSVGSSSTAAWPLQAVKENSWCTIESMDIYAKDESEKRPNETRKKENAGSNWV